MTYFQRHIIIRWCNTRALLHRVSIVNAKPSKSMAPPFPATTSSETSNCQGSGECTEVFYRGVCRRRRSLQYQPQRAPRVWVRKKIQFIAVLSSAPVVWDKSWRGAPSANGCGCLVSAQPLRNWQIVLDRLQNEILGISGILPLRFGSQVITTI